MIFFTSHHVPSVFVRMQIGHSDDTGKIRRSTDDMFWQQKLNMCQCTPTITLSSHTAKASTPRYKAYQLLSTVGLTLKMKKYSFLPKPLTTSTAWPQRSLEVFLYKTDVLKVEATNQHFGASLEPRPLWCAMTVFAELCTDRSTSDPEIISRTIENIPFIDYRWSRWNIGSPRSIQLSTSTGANVCRRPLYDKYRCVQCSNEMRSAGVATRYKIWTV